MFKAGVADGVIDFGHALGAEYLLLGRLSLNSNLRLEIFRFSLSEARPHFLSLNFGRSGFGLLWILGCRGFGVMYFLDGYVFERWLTECILM